jgi:hypothetical protein
MHLRNQEWSACMSIWLRKYESFADWRLKMVAGRQGIFMRESRFLDDKSVFYAFI